MQINQCTNEISALGWKATLIVLSASNDTHNTEYQTMLENNIRVLFPMSLIGPALGWKLTYVHGNGIDGDMWFTPDGTAFLA